MGPREDLRYSTSCSDQIAARVAASKERDPPTPLDNFLDPVEPSQTRLPNGEPLAEASGISRDQALPNARSDTCRRVHLLGISVNLTKRLVREPIDRNVPA